ncbi:MAG: hypothetical protein AAF268_08505 [Cyanobacteria bacterium P01_A01_bin.3]
MSSKPVVLVADQVDLGLPRVNDVIPLQLAKVLRTELDWVAGNSVQAPEN